MTYASSGCFLVQETKTAVGHVEARDMPSKKSLVIRKSENVNPPSTSAKARK